MKVKKVKSSFFLYINISLFFLFANYHFHLDKVKNKLINKIFMEIAITYIILNILNQPYLIYPTTPLRFHSRSKNNIFLSLLINNIIQLYSQRKTKKHETFMLQISLLHDLKYRSSGLVMMIILFFLASCIPPSQSFLPCRCWKNHHIWVFI